jgi:colanic acid biosynthesis glycosyl transferase WcaI
MKLGIVSQWFDPEPGPAAIPGVFAREFVRMGHDVSVLTGFPNYPQGEIYDGFRQSIGERSEVDGASLTRVPLYPNHNASALGRMANYASFAASATAFSRGALKEVDAVWVYNSPITVTAPLMAHTRVGSVPYFLHVQDIWPDSLIESGMFPGGPIGSVASSVIKRIVRFSEKKATVIGVISPSVRELILDRNPGLDPSKILYVPNPTDEGLFHPAPRLQADGRRRDGDRPFTIMYVGAVGEVQGLETVLDAAELLGPRSGIEFVIVGDGIARERIQQDAITRGLNNVNFRGRIDKNLVPEAMAEADVQMVSLASSPFLRVTTPSKISSLLASEYPIIGLIAGDGADLLRDSGAARVLDPGDAEGLAGAALELSRLDPEALKSMARAGRAYYEKHLSAAVTAARITDSLKGAIRG